MTEATAPKVQAGYFDFDNAALFRENLRLWKREVSEPIQTAGSRLVDNKPVSVGDRVITPHGDETRAFVLSAEDFDRVLEVDPSNTDAYRSKNTGRAAQIEQDLTLEGTPDLPLQKGGFVFRSDIDQTIHFFSREDFTEEFSRQFKDGSLVDLSEDAGVQILQSLRTGDTSHLADIAKLTGMGAINGAGESAAELYNDLPPEVRQRIENAAKGFGHLIDTASPHVQKAVDSARPHIERAIDRGMKAVDDARPHVEKVINTGLKEAQAAADALVKSDAGKAVRRGLTRLLDRFGGPNNDQ